MVRDAVRHPRPDQRRGLKGRDGADDDFAGSGRPTFSRQLAPPVHCVARSPTPTSSCEASCASWHGPASDRLDQAVVARLGPLCQAQADVDWQDPTARRAVLGELVDVACELRAAVTGIDDATVAELAGLLDRSSTKTWRTAPMGAADPQP